MGETLFKSLLLSPLLLSATVLFAIPKASAQIIAADPLTSRPKDSSTSLNGRVMSVSQLEATTPSNRANPMAQVTSVSQLSDVKPTDWAFQALQSLVERYGCIVGYPDKKYRGNQAMTRYEFAAGLNACMDRVNELIAAATADLVKKEDLAILQKLQEEFAAELAVLRGRVDALEARTATLEKQQFSTTTKLNGEVIFALASVLGGDDIFGNDIDKNPVLGDRVRLNFDTSFTGRDLLRTRLEAGNLDLFTPVTGTFEGNLRFNSDTGNRVGIDSLLYAFPIGEKTTVVVEANAGETDDFADTFNPFIDGDGGSGALSNFATRNPIYYYADGAGVGIRHEFSDQFELSLGYLAGDAADPTDGNGLFNGRYGAIAQLVIKPSDRFKFGFTYVHSYNNESGTGSSLANPRSLLSNTFDQVSGNVINLAPTVIANPFGGAPIVIPAIIPNPFGGAPVVVPTGGITVGQLFDQFGLSTNIPVVNNSYGFELSWQVSDRFVLNGWVGYTQTRTLSSGGGLFTRGQLDSLNWAIALAFPDLGKKGALGGVIVGMEPKVVKSDVGINPVLSPFAAIIPADIAAAFSEDNATSLHIEAFYQFPVTDNIAITPGIIWITKPGFNDANDDLFLGVVRTTFTF